MGLSPLSLDGMMIPQSREGVKHPPLLFSGIYTNRFFHISTGMLYNIFRNLHSSSMDNRNTDDAPKEKKEEFYP